MSETKGFKINAFFEQFPFLVPFKDGGAWGLETVAVRRISKELLQVVPRHDSVTGSMVSIDERHDVFLLSQDGSKIGEVLQTEDYRSYYSDIEDSYRKGETVADAVQRVGADQVYYILEVEHGYKCENHRSYGRRIVLNKPPKGWSLQEWEQEEREREKATLAAEEKSTDEHPLTTLKKARTALLRYYIDGGGDGGPGYMALSRAHSELMAGMDHYQKEALKKYDLVGKEDLCRDIFRTYTVGGRTVDLSIVWARGTLTMGSTATLQIGGESVFVGPVYGAAEWLLEHGAAEPA